MESLDQTVIIALVVAALAAALVYLWFGRKQRVQISNDIPSRPHMQAKSEGRGLADEAAAAASDVAGEIVGLKIHEELPGASGPPDDLKQLKGVGPKLATILNERGISRFDQIARLSPGQVEALDNSLGAFKGRFEQDQIVEQAHYLARGDIDGYEAKFGKL